MAVSVMWLLLPVSWIGLQCVIFAFPSHTHLHLLIALLLLFSNLYVGVFVCV